MRRANWSAPALADLSRLRDFLFAKNPRAATEAITAIREAVQFLEQFPAAGRLVFTDDPHVREWIVPFSNAGYVLRYGTDGDRVTVLRVRHMREVGF
jgi:plasmid stabilization system protein ParE